MSKKTEPLFDPEIWIEIWSGKKPVQFRAWRYYSIIDALRDAGIGQARAYELGKWARTAKDGEIVTETNDKGFEVKIRAVLK